MNKWRLLLFSVFGLLQITTSDRNFIDGRYSCCDHSQRNSEADTRIISYRPYRVYRDVPDLQQRKLFDSPLSVREQDIKSPSRNVRQRGVLSQDRLKERHAYERRLSRERNYDFTHSERDETRQESLTRNRDELTFRFVDESRYSYKFNDGDRVIRENNNMREYVNNNDVPERRNLVKGLRNNERFVRQRENSEDSVINTRRNFYSDIVPDNRLQAASRNTDTFRRGDQKLFRRNTQVRNRSVIDENLRLVRESTQIEENQVDRRVISKRILDSRHSTSEKLRRERNEDRKRSSPLDSERLLDVRRQVLTQIEATNTIVGHIKYSRKLNEIHYRDNSRTISRGVRNARTTETRGSRQIIEQRERREMDVSTLRIKQSNREISEIRDERNGPREHRAQDNFDYRQNKDSYQNINRDMQRIRGLTDVRSERMVLSERRDYDNDRDRSSNLLLLVRYRYSESDKSKNNRNRILEQNRLNTRREVLTRPQSNIVLENNDLRVNTNKEVRFNTNRQDTSMTNNRNERNKRGLTDTRQERETLHREIRVNRYNIMRDERYSSRLTDFHNDKVDQDLIDVIQEENIIREDNDRQTRRNIRQLVRDVSRITIRNEQRRELADDRPERRASRVNNRQNTLNARQSSASPLRTVNTLRSLETQRAKNTINEQIITNLENIQEKRDFRRQERPHSNNDRKFKIISRNTQEVNFKRRMQEMSVRTDNILNILRNNRENLLDFDRNTQRMDKRQNIRQVYESEIRVASTLNNDDRTYDRIRQNDRDDPRTISRGIQNVRTTKTRGSGQFIGQSDRRERAVNTIRTKQSNREIFKTRERNGPREYRILDNFDYRQNKDSYQNINQDMQRIRGFTDVRSEKMVLREKRYYNNDKDRSRNLLLLVRYRYSGLDDSRNNKNDFRISSRIIRKSYDEEHINRNDERTHRRESERVDSLRFRRNGRDDLRLHRDRSAQTIEIYRTKEDNEGLLRTVHERLSKRTHRDGPKMADRSEESRRTMSQSVTENCESRVNHKQLLKTRTIRGERYSEDRDAGRDLSRSSAVTENLFETSERNIRFASTTYKPDTVTFEMKWQYLFYALQAMYLVSLLTKLPKHEGGKSKLRIITWLTPTKSLKMD